jgi:hypothetical protein
MPATAGMQATAVTPATSNSKDDSNSVTDNNGRNASYSRNASNNRTANTVETEAKKKVGMLAKVVKQQHAGTLLTSEMTAAAETIGTSWMSTAAGPPESDSRKVSNSTVEKTSIFSMDTRNSSRTNNYNITTAVETIGTS